MAQTPLPPAIARYPWLARAVHWTTVAVLVLAYGAMWLGKDLARDQAGRELVEQVHFWAGLGVLALLVLRLLLRLFYRAPPIQPAPPPPVRAAAVAGHLALYVLLLLQPLLGLLTLADEDELLVLPGGGAFAPGTTVLADWADRLGKVEDLHETVALVLLTVVAVHAAAALWHHFGRRDSTLRRMLW
jgi:cytochrome b561